ncbi:MAG: hypothetical protein AB7V77_05975 [Candidatus Woesearchaeota archaeon]
MENNTKLIFALAFIIFMTFLSFSFETETNNEITSNVAKVSNNENKCYDVILAYSRNPIDRKLYRRAEICVENGVPTEIIIKEGTLNIKGSTPLPLISSK